MFRLLQHIDNDYHQELILCRISRSPVFKQIVLQVLQYLGEVLVDHLSQI